MVQVSDMDHTVLVECRVERGQILTGRSRDRTEVGS